MEFIVQILLSNMETLLILYEKEKVEPKTYFLSVNPPFQFAPCAAVRSTF